MVVEVEELVVLTAQFVARTSRRRLLFYATKSSVYISIHGKIEVPESSPCALHRPGIQWALSKCLVDETTSPFPASIPGDPVQGPLQGARRLPSRPGPSSP